MADQNTPAVVGTQTPEAQTAQQGGATAASNAINNDAFDDDSWGNEPVNEVAEEPTGEPAKTSEPAPAATEKKDDEQVVDANEYLKKELGYDDWGTAKKEIDELRQLRTTTPKAQKFDEVVKEKEQDIYDYLHTKRQLENVQKLDLTNPDNAAKLIKMNLQLKHKDLTPEEIDYQFNREYGIPKKPAQKADQDEDEYAEVVQEWEEKVKDRKMAISIAAKIAKPEITQYASTLAIPEIHISQPAAQQPSPQDVAAAKQVQDEYFQAVSKGVSDFKGFEVEYKEGKDVSIPIKFEVTNEDRAKVEPILKSLATDITYFEKRWADPKTGAINVAKMAQDIFLLENQGSVFQKIANEAASQRMLFDAKNRSNIQLDGADGGNVPNRQGSDMSLAEEVWNN